MENKRNNKGFTLAELLVVVAIIAVLVAIAIPIFSTQKKKAEEATEIANARAVYAEGMVAVMDESLPSAGLTKNLDDSTYTFTYDSENNTWSIAIEGGTVYNATITDFSTIEIDGQS